MLFLTTAGLTDIVVLHNGIMTAHEKRKCDYADKSCHKSNEERNDAEVTFALCQTGAQGFDAVGAL